VIPSRQLQRRVDLALASERTCAGDGERGSQ
jgi:hypothetical protein